MENGRYLCVVAQRRGSEGSKEGARKGGTGRERERERERNILTERERERNILTERERERNILADECT